MIPTVESSVIEFPRIEQRSKPFAYTLSEVERGVKIAAEDIRLNWLKSHATSSKVCARTRLLYAAAASDLSDNAFRVLFLQLSYTNGSNLRMNIGNETIAILAHCSERTIKRSNKELEAKKWVSVDLKRRDCAVRTMAIPGDVLAQIGAEIMENLPPRLVTGAGDQDVPVLSLQGVLPGQNVVQDRTKLSSLADQEVTDLALQALFPEFEDDQEGTFLSPQDDQEVTNLSPQGFLPGQNENPEVTDLALQDDLEDYFTRVEPPYFGSNFDLRSAKNGTLICKGKTTRKNKQGAEPVCIQSGREENCIQSESEPAGETQPPIVEKNLETNVKAASVLAASFAAVAAVACPVAAAPVEPPAIVQQVPQTPECWDTPQARQNAFLRAAEAQAQRELIIHANGCLEALGGFRSELKDKFPLVDLECGLMAAAPNIRPYMSAIEAMATIRRQFAYMQLDGKRKADRDAQISASYKSKSEKKKERIIIAYRPDGSPIYGGR